MRERFNDKLHRIKISPIVRISEEVRDKKAAFEKSTGKKFILFQRGEIDFNTPEKILESIKDALDSGKTKYPKAGGEPQPKEEILKKLEEFNAIKSLNPENIVLTYGGQESLQMSLHLFEGKKACGFSPIWSVLIENFIPYSGIDFTEVPLNPDFSIDYDRLEKTLKTAEVFYLNNPHNPTGKVFNEEELTKIGELCQKYRTFIISDEAYEHIVFDDKKHISIASLLSLEDYKDIISCFTFSKTFAMTGLRLGYAATRNTVAAELMKRADYTLTAGVNTAMQEAALVAFSPAVMTEVRKRVNELEQRRNRLHTGLAAIQGLEVSRPEGAFYLFPNFSNFIPKGRDKKEREWHIYKACMENGIAIVPGCCFSKEGYFPDNARFSFSTTSLDMIQEGIERLTGILR